MDVFDAHILSVLKDGKPKLFIQLLTDVAFPQHAKDCTLKKLLSEKVLVREKTASKGLRRPIHQKLDSV
jgi:hypothetical protein